MAYVYKPPMLVPPLPPRSIFLSGSIEMGKAEDWQSRFERELDFMNDLAILNPRRDDWDDTWEQSADNPQFNEQVQWELAGLEQVTLVPVYFDPKSFAPITLLELGLCIHKPFGPPRLIVCCPEGFYRKGNVDVVCKRYHVRQVPDLDALIDTTYRLLEAMP